MAELLFCCLFVSASLSETEERFTTKRENTCLVKKRLSVFKPQKIACWPIICDAFRAELGQKKSALVFLLQVAHGDVTNQQLDADVLTLLACGAES